MQTIEVDCPDGTDPNCHGTVEVKVKDDATEEEIQEAVKWAPSCPACGSDQITTPEDD